MIHEQKALTAELQSIPVINTTNLEKLKKSTASNPAYLVDIFKSFVEDSEELLHDMERGSAQNDHELYYDAVHSLKGLAGTIGFSRKFHLLKIMDAHNKEENFQESVSCIPMAKVCLDEIKEYLNKEFGI